MKALRLYTDNDNTNESTTSSSIAHAAGRVQPTPMELEQIRQMYVDAIGPLNAIKARDIERAMTDGLTVTAILDAIEQTAYAPRPSHAYLRAVLRRYIAEGVHTAEDAERTREAYRAQRAATGRERSTWYDAPASGRGQRPNPALDYAQREYKDEDYGDGFFFDVVKEYGKGGESA